MYVVSGVVGGARRTSVLTSFFLVANLTQHHTHAAATQISFLQPRSSRISIIIISTTVTTRRSLQDIEY